VADIGEEESLVDGDVGGVLIGGGVSGALIGVSFLSHVRFATLLLIVSFLLHLLLPFLVFVPVPVTCIWTFCNEVTRLTTLLAHSHGTGLVVLPLPLFKDLLKALNDKSHLLIVELGGVDWESTWCRLLLLSSIALNATGCTSGVEVAPCSKLTICLEFLIISSKLTNLPITSSGDICVGTMLRRRRSCKKKQLRLKLLVCDAEGIIHEASVL
jgi:hypothetical protein